MIKKFKVKRDKKMLSINGLLILGNIMSDKYSMLTWTYLAGATAFNLKFSMTQTSTLPAIEDERVRDKKYFISVPYDNIHRR